ncbi:uncharacterized protein B0H18DRAFT_950537 [Fomitopsis serialis]|uniref:uncharacterized protein n=1 Tax=Fomitopsis serialis TaxID=139415 RepID=UPI002007ED6F|nr:uncharacterized protein B0H18DRAFT_950537 [Neoantrodia serialis]KAH9936149.1 hypothetical protein B0H18DRAFT_950537 [Neoantrodia serialis]
MSAAPSTTQPIAISHTRASASFLELASPASSSSSPSSPTPSSASSSSSALSPTLSDFALPPADPWRTAAAEAAAGIHYALEAFPAPGQTVLGPPFRNAPLAVGAGARVVLLDAEGEDAGTLHVRARVLETGEVGYLPAWNVEGALERLARVNMEFNEAATCPAERTTLSRRSHSAPDVSRRPDAHADSPSSSPSSHLHAILAHKHDHCIPFSTRLTYRAAGPAFAEDDEDVDPFLLDADETYIGRTRGARRKSVGFAEVARPTVFRYPSAALVEAYYGEAFEEEEEHEGDEREEGGGRRTRSGVCIDKLGTWKVLLLCTYQHYVSDMRVCSKE